MIKLASLLTKNSATLAISSGFPNLPRGIVFVTDSFTFFKASGERLGIFQRFVSVGPGATAFTLTPSLANYKAQHLVKFSTAALEPTYIE